MYSMDKGLESILIYTLLLDKLKAHIKKNLQSKIISTLSNPTYSSIREKADNLWTTITNFISSTNPTPENQPFWDILHSNLCPDMPFNPTPKIEPIRIYIDGAFDCMHSGHYNAIRQAKALGDSLIVGLVADDEVIKNKGPPIMN